MRLPKLVPGKKPQKMPGGITVDEFFRLSKTRQEKYLRELKRKRGLI